MIEIGEKGAVFTTGETTKGWTHAQPCNAGAEKESALKRGQAERLGDRRGRVLEEREFETRAD
jgi:hypothetical protein